MTEAEALDEAAKAAGWGSWEYVKNHCDHSERPGIRAHAKTIMENAALKAEVERLREALRVLRDLPIVENDSPDTLHIDGEPHTGPAVDFLFRVVRKIKLVASAALKEIDNGDR